MKPLPESHEQRLDVSDRHVRLMHDEDDLRARAGAAYQRQIDEKPGSEAPPCPQERVVRKHKDFGLRTVADERSWVPRRDAHDVARPFDGLG